MVKPRPPYKPIEPPRLIRSTVAGQSRTFHNNENFEQMFLWANSTCESYSNITIEVDYNDCITLSCPATIQEIPNTNFERHNKAYQKELAAYEKRLDKYNKDLEVYNKKLEEEKKKTAAAQLKAAIEVLNKNGYKVTK